MQMCWNHIMHANIQFQVTLKRTWDQTLLGEKWRPSELADKNLTDYKTCDCLRAQLLCPVPLFVTPWIVAYQCPLSM